MKSFVIEQALRHHPVALSEIPEEFIISPVVRVSRRGMRDVAEALKNPPPLTSAMRELMGRKTVLRRVV